MKRIIIYAFLIFFAAIWTGCSKDESSNPEVPNPQSYYEIEVNNTVEFKLLEHSDGGYRWQWTNGNKCEKIKCIEFRTESTTSDPDICGAPAYAIWKFKGSKAGVDTLLFKESRGIEPLSTIETKTVVIKVK